MLTRTIAGSRFDVIGVFGTPSALTHWGLHIVRALIETTRGSHDIVHVNDLAGLADAQVGQIEDMVAVYVSDCPSIDVCEFFIDRGHPILIFLEDPRSVISDLSAANGVDSVTALRLATRSLCTLQPLLGADKATIFRSACLDENLDDVLDRLKTGVQMASLNDGHGDLEPFLALQPGGAAGLCVRDHVLTHFPHVDARRIEMAPSEKISIQTTSEAYDPLVTGDAAARFVWPASLFSSGDQIGRYINGPSELLGPARILIYGPYLHLPRGEWTCAAEIEVSGNASGNQLKVDLVCGLTIVKSVVADLPEVGRYSFSMSFAVREPLDPIELRFQIENGAIEGRFLLDKVVMTAIDAELDRDRRSSVEPLDSSLIPG